MFLYSIQSMFVSSSPFVAAFSCHSFETLYPFFLAVDFVSTKTTNHNVSLCNTSFESIAKENNESSEVPSQYRTKHDDERKKSQIEERIRWHTSKTIGTCIQLFSEESRCRPLYHFLSGENLHFTRRSVEFKQPSLF